MGRPESSIMRDELAGLYEMIDALKKANARKDEVIEALLARVAELESENRWLSGRNRRYEGPNAPPSASPIGRGRRRRAKGGGAGPPAAQAARPGPPAGHPGKSRSQKADRTEKRVPDKCGHCDSTDLGEPFFLGSKITVDGILKVVVEYVNNLTYGRRCNGCGRTCVPDDGDWNIGGTGFGSSIASAFLTLHAAHMSPATVARVASDLLGIPARKTAVKKCVRASAGRLEPYAARIRRGVRRMSHVHMDETTFGRGGRGGRQLWDWVAVGKLADGSIGAVVHRLAESRGEAVLRGIFDYGIPVVSDGLRIYRSVFGAVQWCWAHILREARDENARGREAHLLCAELERLFARAKGVERGGRPGRPPRRVVRERKWLEDETLRVAAAFRAAGCGAFGKKLANAAPHLYTFLYYPGMEPTNNAAERMMRNTVIDRRIRNTMRTAGGRQMIGTLLTCTETWRARGLSVAEALRRALAGEAVPGA